MEVGCLSISMILNVSTPELHLQERANIKGSIREQMKVLMKFITNVKLRKIKLGSSIVAEISPSKGLCLLLLCGQNYNSLILSKV